MKTTRQRVAERFLELHRQPVFPALFSNFASRQSRLGRQFAGIRRFTPFRDVEPLSKSSSVHAVLQAVEALAERRQQKVDAENLSNTLRANIRDRVQWLDGKARGGDSIAQVQPAKLPLAFYLLNPLTLFLFDGIHVIFQLGVARLFHIGLPGVVKPSPKGMEAWLRAAADTPAQSPTAQYCLACYLLYMSGSTHQKQNVERHEAAREALEWMKKAALQGSPFHETILL